MSLKSQLFKGDPKLEACLVLDASHITKGASGDHVGKIQTALATLDGFKIDPDELSVAKYGQSTAASVLIYKKKRNIINRTYQSTEDDIVGKMTISSLDQEMFKRESSKTPDADFIGFSDEQREQVKADLTRAKAMLDVVINRMRTVSHTSSSGDLLITPANYQYYETKMKILNVFKINTFLAEDFPVQAEVLSRIRQNFRGVTNLPAASDSPADAINFGILLQNFIRLRRSLNEPFIKEFYRQSTYKGQPLGFYAAFVDANNPADTTVRITKRYFDPLVVPTQDDRAVTLAHERAHTVFRAKQHPGTGDNPFCVAPHLGDPNVKTPEQALANPYCYEWLIDALQLNYSGSRFRGPECGT